MEHAQYERIRESFRTLTPRGAEVFAAFVNRLNGTPVLRAMFPAEPQDHAQAFLSPCGLIVKNLHRITAIEYLLHETGARNQARGVLPQHYGAARDALLATLAEALGEAWTDELADDWSQAVDVVISVFIRGAGRARSKAA